MLRSLVEIVSFSHISQVSDTDKFFFRAVAAPKDDPLSQPYKNLFIPNRLRAGYVMELPDGWYIQPARPIGQDFFVWVKESLIKSAKIPGYISMDHDDYCLQCIPDISFENIQTINSRRFATSVSQDPNKFQHCGTLITSGNMLETGLSGAKLKRKNHCLVGQADNRVKSLKINEEAVQNYRNSLSKFQKASLDESYGVLQADRCIFYCEPLANNEVTLFGHNPYFRIPYQLSKQTRASTVLDFIPQELRDSQKVDFTTSIFGAVQSTKAEDDKTSARKGKIFVSDAYCTSQDDIWYSTSPIQPPILEAPKPSTFQHYLVQESVNKVDLKHYATKTVIRGYKLYWHKGENPTIASVSEVPPEYRNLIRPIKPGICFRFSIRFENLCDEELGAILWVLNLARGKTRCLSLGMCKPFGMGAVKIHHELTLSDRETRYKRLFQENQWNIAEKKEINKTQFTAQFEKYMLQQIPLPPGSRDVKFSQIMRIQELKTMLSWDENPSVAFLEETRYMTIQPNEFKDRPILPTPQQVIKESPMKQSP
jgi:CRISPR-associated protein (TIGR03986 family)